MLNSCTTTLNLPKKEKRKTSHFLCIAFFLHKRQICFGKKSKAAIKGNLVWFYSVPTYSIKSIELVCQRYMKLKNQLCLLWMEGKNKLLRS